MRSNNTQIATIRLDLLDLNKSANEPQFKSLISDGWTVISSLAVQEEERPTLILLLAPPKEEIRVKVEKEIKIKLIIMIIIQILIAIILIKGGLYA